MPQMTVEELKRAVAPCYDKEMAVLCGRCQDAVNAVVEYFEQEKTAKHVA